MNLSRFSEVNRSRCEAPDGFAHRLSSWSLSDWMTATLGELGEAANVVKKLNRVRDDMERFNMGIAADVLRDQLADELADAAIYLDLMCQAAGLDLSTIMAAKFNKTSKKHGCPILFEDAP